MKPLSYFLIENKIHPNLIEYLTRQVFKKKNLKRALSTTDKALNHSKNFLLGGQVEFTVAELEDAYYRDKVEHYFKKGDKLKNAPNPEMYFQSICAHFCLDPVKVKAYL